jgi:hypothetical protein
MCPHFFSSRRRLLYRPLRDSFPPHPNSSTGPGDGVLPELSAISSYCYFFYRKFLLLPPFSAKTLASDPFPIGPKPVIVAFDRINVQKFSLGSPGMTREWDNLLPSVCEICLHLARTSRNPYIQELDFTIRGGLHKALFGAQYNTPPKKMGAGCLQHTSEEPIRGEFGV